MSVAAAPFSLNVPAANPGELYSATSAKRLWIACALRRKAPEGVPTAGSAST